MVARLVDVEKSYGAQPVLRGVTLAIEAGDFLSLIGRSGSGKSTLLHLLGGLDRRYRGTVEVLGRDLAALDERALGEMRNHGVGFVFQSFNLLDHLSVLENVALPAWVAPAPLPRAAVEKRAREALERVSMADRAESRPAELSGGQKQRVAIARALFSDPRLLLADEPTGNLDSETGAQIIELFARLNREGLTLIVVTHEERVSRAAGRVMRLEDGRILDGAGP